MKLFYSFLFFFQVFIVNSRSCGSGGCGSYDIPWNYYNTPIPYNMNYAICGPNGCVYQAPYRARPCAHSPCGYVPQPCGSYGVIMQHLQPHCSDSNDGHTVPVDPHQIIGGNGRDCPRGFVWDKYRQRCVRVFGRK